MKQSLHGAPAAMISPRVKKHIKDTVASTTESILGRYQFARLGRFLWMRSRLDVPNNLAENGEILVQRAFIDHVFSQRGRQATAIDIGAHKGSWSVQLIREFLAREPHQVSLSLHAFEPSSSTREVLEGQLAGFEDIESIQTVVRSAALGAESGTASFVLEGATAGVNHLSYGHAEPREHAVEVQVTTLDEYSERTGLSKIDLIKIDAEGHDFSILSGARSLFEDERLGLVQFEYNHRWVSTRHYLKDVFELVADLPYSIGKVTPRGVERYKEWHSELESFREGNYLIFHDGVDWAFPTVPWWYDQR